MKKILSKIDNVIDSLPRYCSIACVIIALWLVLAAIVASKWHCLLTAILYLCLSRLIKHIND